MRTHIMIHHSLTKDSGTVSWAAIEKYHRETNGWNDIGYHAGIELVSDSADLLGGYQYQALYGRELDRPASACPQGGMNNVALHVCCVGNYDLVEPPPALLRCLIRRILLPWTRAFRIPPENIVGHRDYNSGKSCPGTRFNLDALRVAVRRSNA